MTARGLQASEAKMRAAGVHEAAIAAFRHSYEALEGGETGLISEAAIEPVDDLPAASELPEPDPRAVRAALDACAVIKLNGGLGTSMGMTRAKSLLEVRPGLTFLDLIARQVLALRERHGARVPLILMNSFRTREDSLALLAGHPALAGELPADFVQSREPKLRADDLTPVEWPPDPALEWCPPGHGDIYTALVTSGLLDDLLERGFRTAFVSNSDNLGATLDERILAWFAAEEVPFCMEVSRRSEADRKGGHLARLRASGGLVLREAAQTADADRAAFEDIERHRYFNTNSLWLSLPALRGELERRGGVLGLPLIVNRKTTDPGDPSSPAVLQLETAMGAAIASFAGARGLVVGRERFAPVKTTNELLALRSDAYELRDGARVLLAGGRAAPPIVDLDPEHYRLLAGFEARFPAGPPSLRHCERLTVRGDVTFGAGVSVRGQVAIEAPAPLRLDDGALLEG